MERLSTNMICAQKPSQTNCDGDGGDGGGGWLVVLIVYIVFSASCRKKTTENALGLITLALQVCIFSFTGSVLIEPEHLLNSLDFSSDATIIYLPICFVRGA